MKQEEKTMTKKKIIAGLMTSTMAAAMFVSAALPAKAALPPQGMRIEGAGSVRVGKTIELDTDIYPDDDLVSEWNIVWKSKKPSVAKVIHTRGEDTRIKGLKAGTAKIVVQIKGTNIKATKKITVKKNVSASTESASDKKKLKKYKKQIKKIRKQIAATAVPATWAERRIIYRNFERKLDNVDRKIDVINDRWDDRWGSTARSMEIAVDRVENYLESVEDYLEHRFAWDEDRYDRDYDDRYDDDRYDWDD